jgi:hypothetical protein
MAENEVRSSVDRVNDEIAVGTNMRFQHKWWRAERIVWAIMTILLVAGAAGVMGRGPLAKAKAQTEDGSLQMQYERFERYKTPSMLALTLNGSAIQNHTAVVWISNSLLKNLGMQRIVPQPAVSQPGGNRTLYAFPAEGGEARLQFALEPSQPGIYDIAVGVLNGPEVHRKVIVWP